ncbi:MAG: DUF3795 domain-containing protein [Treponema sp.]
MDRSKGIGRCGLACCICTANEGKCPGCRKDGCPDMDWCLQYTCSRKKGLHGCWECADAPCSTDNLTEDQLSAVKESSLNKKNMFAGLKMRAFTLFVKQYGEEKLMDCLERNEKAGVVYHEQGSFCGDYDRCADENAVFNLLLNGK